MTLHVTLKMCLYLVCRRYNYIYFCKKLKYFTRCSIYWNTWCDNNHLLINFKKTNYMLVCSRQKKSHLKCFSLKINLYGEYIKMKSDVKVLGITVDEHLSWSCHIDRVCTKISQLIGVLFCMRHFLDFKTKIMFYNSYILPQIDYGINMWKNQLHVIQKKYKYYKIRLHVSYLMLTGIPLVMCY